MSHPTGGEFDSSKDDGSNNFASIRGTKCFVHLWNVHRPGDTKSLSEPSTPPRALVVLFHGFLAHGSYPTVRYAAEFFAAANYAVVAIDFPGHGRSEGIRGYLKSADDLIEDGVAMVEYAQSLCGTSVIESPPPRMVLCGSSMGGAIALAVAHKLACASANPSLPALDGNIPPPPLVILLAPMLQLNVSLLERTALQCLAFVAPTAELIPSSATDSIKQYRDATKRQECDDDALTVSGSKLRVASALSCIDLTWKLQNEFGSAIENPFLLLIADEDVVVKNSGSEAFFAQSASTDKTKRNYPALHGLLCEPSPLFDEIKGDILGWLDERT